MLRKIIFFLILNFIFFNGYGQNAERKIKTIEAQINILNNREDSLYKVLEQYKLKKLRQDIVKYDLPAILPGEKLIKHSAMFLVYSETHEQAKWVAHIISPDIAYGNLSRTNDFRPDTMIKTGSAVERDYFIKTKLANGKYKYDGFGFDRGHLAPSADFRWSPTAISESYLYSNMSPQRPQFNRGGWAKLEDLLRAYVIQHKTALMVVTGPVLTDTMKVVRRSIDHVSIPDYFFKVAYDTATNRGIGFIMPNKKITKPIEYYAVTIDSVENFTGLDLYASLPDSIENKMESHIDVKAWLPEKQKNDVLPLTKKQLKHNEFNTLQAKFFANKDKKVTICGTVVSIHKSHKGNIFLNLDRSYPNQIFTVTIFSKNVVNFGYDPSKYLKDKKVCVRGKISLFNGTPSMIIEDDHHIKLLNQRL
jgi:endonuclease G